MPGTHETVVRNGLPRKTLTVQPMWEKLGHAIIVTDCDLEPPGPIIRYVNQAFTRLTGYQAADVIGRSPRLLQTCRTDHRTKQALKKDLLEQGAAQGTLLNRRKDGREYLCSLAITPLLGRDGETTHFICIARDLSASDTEVNRRLSEEYEQAQALIEDLEARQSEAEQIIERQHTEIRRLAAQHREALERFDTLNERLAAREHALDLQCRENARSDAELRASLEELHAMDEEVRATLIAMEESNIKLEHANAELRLSQAANADKLRLLATASHDLRQPVMSLGLLLDVLAHRLGPEERPLMGGLMAAHRAIQTMLDGMLDAARLDAGVMTPDIGPVAVQDVLQNLRYEFTLQAEMRGLRFRVVLSSSTIISDAQLLERILRNLVSNALKYTERGGIVVGCRRRGGRLLIEVWDSGPGIPPDARKMIFNEFQQLGNQERDQRRGVGLGLSIVARLAQRLKHEVQVRSWLGRGSVFFLTIPLADAAQPAKRSPVRSLPFG